MPISLKPQKDVVRLRELLRVGFVILVAEGDEAVAVQRATAGTVRGPVTTYSLDSMLGGKDVVLTLGIKSGEAWIIRPDAYVAAIVEASDPGKLLAALQRAQGYFV